VVNLALAFATGAVTRVQENIQQRMAMPYTFMPTRLMMTSTMVFALLFSAVVFWFLISRRRAFFAASS